MHRVASVFLVVAACARPGTTPNAPVPPEPPGTDGKATETAAKPADPTPAKPADPTAPPATPAAKAPHDASIAAPKPTVKLVSAGNGKKSKLAIAAIAGKLPVDVELGFSVKQDEKRETLPGIVFHADADVSATSNDATTYKLAVTKVEVHDVPDETRPPHFEDALAALAGLSINGSVHGDGTRTDITLHHDSVDPPTAGTIDQLVKPGILPWWPVLPGDAIGQGAKWQVTTARSIGLSPTDQLEITETVDFELVTRKDKSAEIKGTIKIDGAAQEIAGAKITNIGGGGTFTATLVDGLFATTHAADLTKVNVEVPGETPAGPPTSELKFSNDVVATKERGPRAAARGARASRCARPPGPRSTRDGPGRAPSRSPTRSPRSRRAARRSRRRAR